MVENLVYLLSIPLICLLIIQLGTRCGRCVRTRKFTYTAGNKFMRLIYSIAIIAPLISAIYSITVLTKTEQQYKVDNAYTIARTLNCTIADIQPAATTDRTKRAYAIYLAYNGVNTYDYSVIECDMNNIKCGLKINDGIKCWVKNQHYGIYIDLNDVDKIHNLINFEIFHMLFSLILCILLLPDVMYYIADYNGLSFYKFVCCKKDKWVEKTKRYNYVLSWYHKHAVDSYEYIMNQNSKFDNAFYYNEDKLWAAMCDTISIYEQTVNQRVHELQQEGVQNIENPYVLPPINMPAPVAPPYRVASPYRVAH